MHAHRRRARLAAWYDEPGMKKSMNPFRHRNTLPQKRRPDLEGGGNLSDSPMENVQAVQDYQAHHPINGHAGSEPLEGAPASSGVSHPDPISSDTRDFSSNGQFKDSSEDSGTFGVKSSDATTAVASDPSDGQTTTRKRKLAFLGNIGKSKEEKTTAKEAKRRGRSASWLKRDEQTFTMRSQFDATILNSWINILLLAVPIGIAVNYAHIAPVAIFVINFIAIIPLAAMLSTATEEIALRTGETIGGLLNATFGNAVELIVSVLALVKGEVDIVQESLIGSILSNLLLVMGMCFFFGGLDRPEQYFNVTVAQTASSLLALAVGSLIIPAAFQAWADGDQTLKTDRITELSRGTAILLLVVYACYLFFQLKTHSSMFSEKSQKVERKHKKADEASISEKMTGVGNEAASHMVPEAGELQPQKQSEEEEKEMPSMSKWVALSTLAISTALVALCAEFMVDSIDAITEGGAVSRTFVGLILLPIVGNAAEHATAVTVACKDKMDLAIGVAVGSSMQIALLVIPFTVVLGWILNNNDMNLAFDGFQIAVLFVAVLLVNYLIQDGKSHWLEGVLLMILYMIIALAAWFYPPDDPATVNKRSLHFRGGLIR